MSHEKKGLFKIILRTAFLPHANFEDKRREGKRKGKEREREGENKTT